MDAVAVLVCIGRRHRARRGSPDPAVRRMTTAQHSHAGQQLLLRHRTGQQAGGIRVDDVGHLLQRVTQLVVHRAAADQKLLEQLFLESRNFAERADSDQCGRPFDRVRQPMSLPQRVVVVGPRMDDRERTPHPRQIVADFIDETLDRFAAHGRDSCGGRLLKISPPRLSGWLVGFCTTQHQRHSGCAEANEPLGQAQWGNLQSITSRPSGSANPSGCWRRDPSSQR